MDADDQALIQKAVSAEVLKRVIMVPGKKIGSTIRRQPVHSGREGLALPEITPQSTDAQVADMQKELGSARQQVQQRRNMLREDAIRVIRIAENAF